MSPVAQFIDQIQQRKRRLYWHPVVKDMKRRAARSANHLKPIYDRTHLIKPGAKLLMTMGRDENARIPYFLEYYRNLGIDHFLFVDNQSDPPMADLFANESDVSLWHTDEAYAATRFGVDWMNALLSAYAIGHWVLTVDLDEFFVHPFMGQRSYGELLSFLDDSEKPSLFTLLVDMYPEGPIANAHVPAGDSPLAHAPYFDCVGYYATKGGHGDTWMRGGPRLRAFNAADFSAAPSINKTPLIKWQPGYAYYLSTHVAYPALLNHAHRKFHEPTGALLHFKFVSSFREKIDHAIRLKNHYSDSGEYQKYLDHLQHSEDYSLHSALSAKYEGPESLIDADLMTAGCWK
ncbi:MAG: glycosyltransferase family 2 protein [Akkermansiaceae bacterium]